MSNIEIQHGDLLKAPAEALVNTVNCVGVMGKGIALQFARSYEENTLAYKKACKNGTLQPGQVLVVKLQDQNAVPRFILNFATKDHWRGKSKLAWIQTGLAYLVHEIKVRGITSVALPPLGCGNGGLDWDEVYPLIEAAFAALPDVRVLLFPPEGAPQPETMQAGKAPKMTLANALYLHLVNIYSALELSFSQLEIQKLAYFLQEQEDGEPLKLHFQKDRYGPYAPQMRHVLQHWENHWMTGYGDGTGGPRRSMALRPHAVEDAEEFLNQHATPETWERLRRVKDLIEGFETAYGLELLATTYWITRENPQAARDLEVAIVGVRDWSDYKSKAFQPDFVRVAWKRLRDQGWLQTSDNATQMTS